MLRLSEVAFGEPTGSTAPVKASYVPLFAHLAWCWRPASICRHRWWPGSRAWRGCWGEERRMACLARHHRSRAGRQAPPRPGRASSSTRRPGGRRSLGIAAGEATLLGLWSDGEAVHLALLAEERPSCCVVSLPCPERRFPSVGAHASARAAAGAHHPRSLRAGARGLARHAPLARPRPLGRAPPARARARRRPPPAMPTPSSRPKARRCTRSRSGPCMPASSSPATSASPPTARPSCAWRSGWATCTRASTA